MGNCSVVGLVEINIFTQSRVEGGQFLSKSALRLAQIRKVKYQYRNNFKEVNRFFRQIYASVLLIHHVWRVKDQSSGQSCAPQRIEGVLMQLNGTLI